MCVGVDFFELFYLEFVKCPGWVINCFQQIWEVFSHNFFQIIFILPMFSFPSGTSIRYMWYTWRYPLGLWGSVCLFSFFSLDCIISINLSPVCWFFLLIALICLMNFSLQLQNFYLIPFFVISIFWLLFSIWWDIVVIL